MKIKSIYKSISTAIILAVSASCTADFVDMNINPNTSVVANPESLLAPTLHDLVWRNQNRAMRLTNEIMQVHVTTVDSREFHRYFIRPTESDYMWRNWYLQLTDIKDIYNKAEETRTNGFETFKGLSRVLEAWTFSLLTDMFGDIPYTEANQGRIGNVTPVFDPQRDVYFGLFELLEEANTLLSTSGNLPGNLTEYDPLYQGNALLWRKFGNSIYLRLLLRASGKAEVNAAQKIREIIENPSQYPIFTNPTESAILPLGSQQPLTSAFWNFRDFDFNGDKGYTEFFINNLNSWQDPRLPIWSTMASGIYAGIPSGWSSGQIPERQSTLQVGLKTDPRMGNIINHAEVQFILAESALKGYINGNPKDYYESGIISALAHWDLEAPDGFLNRPFLAWEEDWTFDEKMDAILKQKYFALFFTDFQQWYEHRRTGHPVLIPGDGMLNGGRMPARFGYPINVQALNAKNYNEALQRMGPDNINTKVWWNTED
ncbi:SusD/RagB family nutrient-binding outer membrane lipoprotein [Belliella kenyensis]|uniref:SusD/RagB family nutrient-binding outer membrane lipoprotein n=1 Tax=Belliella kenyensis TaxID=1472724 RepID=A0ABV8ELY0_9BACT|nr:SusD/RagB family nutrient-binding outer membrane lipoprotein [Belliella kenyensis]MCH7400311.1 SusD/RagB family nutrient-binding outer membrane lipoprotein [Belliella kenyensis]MDN3604671.1 SusD/RagB family nutrient-binding outer membrane lipoprotein [Belliella kenyensis]